MLYKMQFRILLPLAFGSIMLVRTLSSQVIFNLPKPVEDFSLYTSPMHCDALANRLSQEMAARKDTSFLEDKFEMELKGLRVIDSTPIAIQPVIRKCLERFDPNEFPMSKDKYGVDHYDVLTRLYWKAGDVKSFFAMVDRKDMSIPSDSLKAKDRFRNSVLSAVEAVKPINFEVYDSLVYSYFLNDAFLHGEDIKKFKDRIDQMDRMAALRLRINPEDRLRRLVSIAQVIDSMDLERLANGEVSDSVGRILSSIKHKHRYILSEIRKVENLDSLERFGPEGYFRGLIRNSHLAGFDTVSAPPTPIGRRAASLNAMYIFSPEGNNVRLTSHTVGNTPNVPSGIPEMSRPAVMIFIDRPIPKKSRNLNHMATCGFGGKGRYLGAEWCHAMIKYLRFLNEAFSDLQIVMVVPTRGHLGRRLTSDPKEEADLMRKVFQDFHGIRTNIVVYHTDFYKMPWPDERRVNLPPEYERDYKGNGKGNLYYGVSKPPPTIPGFLLAPGGVVIADNVGPASHDVLERLMRWYRDSSRTASSRVDN